MSGFIGTNGKALSAVHMHVGGSKRLRLEGVGPDKTRITVTPNQPAVVTCRLVSLFDGPRGIWTIDLKAGNIGEAIIIAKLDNKEVANLAVCVEPRLSLPAVATDYEEFFLECRGGCERRAW